MSKKNESIDYESKILDCIRENPSGITITDIAKEKGYSRNTISKYVSMLEIKEKIFRRKVGAYNLYFSSKKNFFPKEIISSYYKALLSGLKKNYPNDEEIFKDIGRDSLEFIDFSFGPTVRKGLKSLRNIPVPKLYFEVFGKFYPSYDILQPSIEISEPIMNESGKKAIYRFKNSEFLDKTEDFTYHFYIVSGIIEALWEREVGSSVKCIVEKIHVGNRKDEAYFELSIEIK
ncbi:MAG: winged helix-turn-helix domain-containing protein [Promethearchaeota archaeon]|nr:MAG: winged helix-turn-helix domain-containing protein [Candidatus Lokiarchaeota archaeon]